MRTITNLRLKKDRRGVSNIIIVVLSLVIITVIASNVVLWSYQMNQLDWEKMKEDIKITDVTRVSPWFVTQSEYRINVGSRASGTYTDTQVIDGSYEKFTEATSGAPSYYPSGYILCGSTSWVLGSVSDLTSDDGVYMTFRSYSSGTDTSDFVDNNTSDVDSSTNKGTHGNFSAQQYGPDSSFDILTEEDTLESWGDYSSELLINLGAEFGNITSWTATGPNAANFAAGYDCSSGSAGPHTGSYAFYWNNPSSSSDWAYQEVDLSLWLLEIQSGEAQITAKGWLVCSEYHVPPWDIVRMKVVFYDNSSQEISSATYDTGERGDLQAWTEFGIENYTIPTNAVKVRIWFQTFENGWDAGNADDFTVKVRTYNRNYELDLEVQWTNVNYGEENEELCIYAGALDLEDIRVDVWTGSVWQNLFTDLTSGWNNVSVSSYLDSSTFTIRFKGGIETGDTTQDNWNIDVTLLHVWSDEYTMEVEFVGSSNTENWTQLTWTIDSAWTSGSVSVTLQLYNYTLGNYPTSGNGYMRYLISSANTDENQSQTITQNPTHFRNATGYWKMKVKGVKATDTSFDFKADWVELSPVVSYTNYQLDSSGTFTIDLSTYPLAYIQTVEIQLRYMANGTSEKWYLKAYNWTDTTYSDSGFNSTAGHIPTTGWDCYAVNLTDQWRSYIKDDGTMYIKFHDEEPDNNQTTIDIDFLGTRALFDGMLFVFKNDGAMTTHLVSLWVINSTIHQRYGINVFINPGETLSYLSTDIRLPDGHYTVKVITERGNVAVYSGG